MLVLDIDQNTSLHRGLVFLECCISFKECHSILKKIEFYAATIVLQLSFMLLLLKIEFYNPPTTTACSGLFSDAKHIGSNTRLGSFMLISMSFSQNSVLYGKKGTTSAVAVQISSNELTICKQSHYQLAQKIVLLIKRSVKDQQ